MNESLGGHENFALGEIRENMANLGGFRYTLIEQDATHVKALIKVLGRAVDNNIGEVRDGDTILIGKDVWAKFELISIPGYDTDKIASSLARLVHEIRGRLANIIGGATEKKNIPSATANRLRNEINERCISILLVLDGLKQYRPAFDQVMNQYIESETLSGRRKNRIIPNLKGYGSEYELIISLLEIAGTSRESAERFFSGSLNRTLQKNEISED